MGNGEKEIAYRHMYRGCIFGLEDYLYRIPENELHEMFDEKSFFCDHEIRKTPKNKFYVRYMRDCNLSDENSSKSDKANYQLMRIKFKDLCEMQELFEEFANDLFQNQIN